MGKNKKRKKGGKARNAEASGSPPRMPHSKHGVLLPLPFPSGLTVPTDSFLRNESPYEEAFQAAFDTAYEGFVVDLPSSTDELQLDAIQNALDTLDEEGFFRTDVTQPFGLGTKCAKTYVTRCLLGDQGTTYKYLGLRMFAYPWNKLQKTSGSGRLEAAVDTIRQLNTTLTERTTHHLSELDKRRRLRGGEPTRGRAAFDITLINRMENTADLKQEPSMKKEKCTVSWHADSSLEHYSTIAVYHTVTRPGWSVALRVAHNSEGPEAARRGTDITPVGDTPPVAISLPSGAAYYLLDDFNHHHQHAVLAGEGIRFSSTHRLLRESHNVNYLLERCRKVCSMFHKKGKIWRSEQLLLTKVESEWIRQFYIQGQQHYDKLWKHWGDSFQQLLHYWSLLETRTKQTIDFLQAAAEGRCAIDPLGKKKREKRRKALETMAELMSRMQDNDCLYGPVADLLRKRAEMRRQWKKREEDHVFRELDHSQRPLAVPFHFLVEGGGAKHEVAVSPMPGLPDDIAVVADRIDAWGRAYASGNPVDLPILPETFNDAKTAVGDKGSISTVLCDSPDEHCVSLSWKGWGNRDFGLEMQSPWAGLLLEGKKTIETRAYDLPPALLGKRIEILQSRQGGTVSSLGNTVSISSVESNVTRVGWCTFTEVIRYQDKQTFEAEEAAHMVTRESGFGWKEGTTKTIYGWVVGNVGIDMNGCSSGKLHTIVRRHRSLFELRYDQPKSSTSKPRKKRKRY